MICRQRHCICRKTESLIQQRLLQCDRLHLKIVLRTRQSCSAKVTTIPRCRDSVISTTIATPQSNRAALSIENPHTAASSNLTFAAIDDNKMTSFFESILTGNASPIPYADTDARKNGSRLPLEAVPEMNELDVANSRYSFDPTLPIPHHPHAVQPSPVLITFDSSSLKRRP